MATSYRHLHPTLGLHILNNHHGRRKCQLPPNAVVPSSSTITSTNLKLISTSSVISRSSSAGGGGGLLEMGLVRNPSSSSSQSFSFFPYSSSCCAFGGGGSSGDKLQYMGNASFARKRSVGSTTTAAASLSAATTSVSEVTLGLLGSRISPLFGLEWWAFIVLTTVLLRFVTLPLEIYGTKLDLEIAPITQKLEDSRLSRNEFFSVFKENRVNIVNTFVLMIINDIIYISVVLAIMFMVKRAPSVKQGGAYWFLDLTKPDPLHMFPFLSVLIALIRTEFEKKPVKFGTRVISTEERRFCWMVMAYLKFSVLKWFPSALFCYWISSEVFELLYVIAIKHPKVKKFLKLP